MISREEAVEYFAYCLTELKMDTEAIREAYELAIEDMQKQIPKKPKEYEDKYYGCPVCGNNLMHKWLIYPEKLMPKSNGLPCCLNCLQAIDWSDNE